MELDIVYYPGVSQTFCCAATKQYAHNTSCSCPECAIRARYAKNM
jgi:hypothetical protein